jgi:hypothetical protein
MPDIFHLPTRTGRTVLSRKIANLNQFMSKHHCNTSAAILDIHLV